MTDKVHPVVEAMARELCRKCGWPEDQPLTADSDKPAWMWWVDSAKAAAKVLLEIKLSDAVLEAGAQAYEASPCMDLIGPLEAAWSAMTSRALKEMGL